MRNKADINQVLLVLACLALAISSVVYMYAAHNAKQDGEEAAARSGQWDESLLELMSVNLDTDYPNAPEDVLRMADDASRLMYSGALTDPETLSAVLSKQRELYAPELLELNPFPKQLDKLARSVEEAASRRIFMDTTAYADLFFDENDPNTCVISSITRISGESDLYYNVYLKRGADGRWKILAWDPVDGMFRRR